MHVPSTSPSIVDVLGRGDWSAKDWTKFFGRYRDVILWWCHQRGLQHADAEDLTQKILVKLVKKMPDHRHDPARGRFHDWLERVVVNAVIDWHRHRQCHPEPVAIGGSSFQGVLNNRGTPEAVDELCTTIDHQVNKFLARKMEAVRARLNKPTTWESFWMLQVEERPVEDVAAELGLSIAAVYKNARRVNLDLAMELKDARPSE